MVTVTECTTLGKGRLRFHLDNGTELVLYRGEAKQFRMREGSTLSDEEEHQLIYEVVGKRAKRRTMHLLEQMDRTEQQLREKLKQGGYPQACIDLALEYVKSFHYVDDYRYACTYINYRQDRMSRYQLKVKLYGKENKKNMLIRIIRNKVGEETVRDDNFQVGKENTVKGNATVFDHSIVAIQTDFPLAEKITFPI